MNNEEIINKFWNMPYKDIDKICLYNHKHKKYKGNCVLPLEEQEKNRLLRIINYMLDEAIMNTRNEFLELLINMEENEKGKTPDDYGIIIIGNILEKYQALIRYKELPRLKKKMDMIE